jgi:hypothetical protein
MKAAIKRLFFGFDLAQEISVAQMNAADCPTLSS